jgi:hypothetical protein
VGIGLGGSIGGNCCDRATEAASSHRATTQGARRDNPNLMQIELLKTVISSQFSVLSCQFIVIGFELLSKNICVSGSLLDVLEQ